MNTRNLNVRIRLRFAGWEWGRFRSIFNMEHFFSHLILNIK